MRRSRLGRTNTAANGKHIIPFATNVSISGTLVQGQTLTGNYTYNPGTGGPESGSTYRWFRNGVAIGGAVATTYVLTVTDLNTNISFEVTPKSLSDTGLPVVSAEVGPISSVPTAGSLGISGTNAVTGTRTGSYTYANADGTVESGTTIQWERADDGSGANTVSITGATALAYDLQAEDYTKFIRFTVTPRSSRGVVGVKTNGAWVQCNTAPLFAAISATNQLRLICRDKTKFLQIGNTLTFGFTPGHMARLTTTKVAVNDITAGNTFRVFAFSTATGNWTEEGSGHAFGVNVSRPCGLQDNRLVIWFSAAAELRVYDWNGTAFNQVGNSFSMTDTGPNMGRMTNSIFGLIRVVADTIERIAFDGTNMALVGSATGMAAGGNFVQGQVSALRTAVYNLTTQVIENWNFDNPGWSQVGADTNVSAHGSSLAMCGFQGTFSGLVRNSSSLLRFYQFDGNTFVLQSGTLNIGADSPFSLAVLTDPGA